MSRVEFQLIQERTSSGVAVGDPTAVLAWRNSAGTRVEVILHKHPGGALEYHVEDDGERVATYPDRHRARIRASERMGGHADGDGPGMNPGVEG